jgi:5-methylcytosine-specific restriction endonuclease McrA
MDYFTPAATEEEVGKEREKAKRLRASKWWKRKCSRGICHFCGEKFPPGELTMDHVVPLIRGGKSSRVNLVPACKACNSSKKHMLPIEWDEYLEGFKKK